MPKGGMQQRLLYRSSISTTHILINAMSIGYLYVRFPIPCSFVANIFFEVLHPRFKTFYFSHHNWPKEWIDKALSLRAVWMARYKSVPAEEPYQPAPVSAPVTVGSHTKSRVDFNIILNYGHQVGQGSDVEEYPNAPPLPREMDPIGYWLRQRKAGEAIANPNAITLAQMALDYLSVPGLFFVI